MTNSRAKGARGDRKSLIDTRRDTLLDRLEAPGFQDGYPYKLIDEAVAEIKLLRKERDQARRLVCLGFSKPGWLSKQTGQSMGWDYLFKEDAK